VRIALVANLALEPALTALGTLNFAALALGVFSLGGAANAEFRGAETNKATTETITNPQTAIVLPLDIVLFSQRSVC
jgi:hypothetical protein